MTPREGMRWVSRENHRCLGPGSGLSLGPIDIRAPPILPVTPTQHAILSFWFLLTCQSPQRKTSCCTCTPAHGHMRKLLRTVPSWAIIVTHHVAASDPSPPSDIYSTRSAASTPRGGSKSTGRKLLSRSHHHKWLLEGR